MLGQVRLTRWWSPGWIGVLVILGLLSACQRPGEADRRAPSAGVPSTGSTSVLHTIDEQQFAQVLQRHRGKVVLVDYWASWCPPCVELLPHTIQLHRRWASRGLAVLTVSFDDAEGEAKAESLLRAHKATTENFRSPYGSTSESWERFGISGSVDAIPHVQLYDRSGNLRRSFGADSGPFGPKDIERAVEELLAEG